MDVNSHNKYGVTALLTAIMVGDVDVARLLIENGADVNAKADDGDVPLIFAAIGNMADIARLLIEHGADVNDKTDGRESVLIVGSEKRPYEYSETSKGGRGKGITLLVQTYLFRLKC